MSFVNPSFLFALSAIAIPIIIHLFNFRKFKTVYFSSIRFLKEVKQETQAKSKLKHLLVLAARILTILFLVLAFAEPYIPSKNQTKKAGVQAVSIFIDNSFSMESINKSGTLLDQAKKKALEIVSAYQPNDRFQLYTNDFEGKHQRLITKDEFIEFLDEIKISPSSKKMTEITSRGMDVLQQSDIKNKNLYIISDFQKTPSDFTQIKNDTAIKVNLVPLVATQKINVYIDSCWFESPIRQINQVEKLHVKIVNNSDIVIENNAIKLYINNQQKTPASFSVDKNSETEIVLNFVSKESGVQHCKVQLNDYPVTFDDSFYFTFDVAKNITVLSVNSKETEPSQAYLSKLFMTDSLFVYKSVAETQIDYSTLSLNHLIVINDLKTISSGLTQELLKFVERGGSVLVFPYKNADISSYNTFLSAFMMNTIEMLDTVKTKVDKINLEHSIYKDVFDKKTFTSTNLDLPFVHRYYRLNAKSQSKLEHLLTLQNGSPFLSKYNYKKGNIYFCSVSLDESFGNFSKHALFVPTLYKIAMNSQTTNPLYYTIAQDEIIEVKNASTNELVLNLIGINNSVEVIPETKLMDFKIQMNVHGQILQADNFNLKSGKEIIAGLSFNFNRLESDLTCLTEDELVKETERLNYTNYTVIGSTEKSLKNIISEFDYGTKLWKLCIILALLFIATEILLLRYIKG